MAADDFGMMAGRADRAERVAGLAVGNSVDGGTDAAHRTQRRLAGERVHRRIRIELHVSVVRDIFEHRLDIKRRVHSLDLPQRPFRRLVPMQEGEFLRFQRRHHRLQACRSLGVPVPHLVAHADGMIV